MLFPNLSPLSLEMKRGFFSELSEAAGPAACISLMLSAVQGMCSEEREREWPFLAPSPDSQKVLSEKDSENFGDMLFFFRTAP